MVLTAWTVDWISICFSMTTILSEIILSLLLDWARACQYECVHGRGALPYVNSLISISVIYYYVTNYPLISCLKNQQHWSAHSFCRSQIWAQLRSYTGCNSVLFRAAAILRLHLRKIFFPSSFTWWLGEFDFLWATGLINHWLEDILSSLARGPLHMAAQKSLLYQSKQERRQEKEHEQRGKF